ncbi:hypothetical protein B0H13DRAFT_2374198 [Mycena leptocephala]|nr:hypothetical protein B0H13DRAFT_2374198 [Mycena leptocephala]
MADPAGALWFALLQLLILSLSQEICPLRGLSTQSTSSSLKLATTSPPAFFYARHKSWDWYWPCQNRCPLLHRGPFGFNPDPILFFTVLSLLPAASLHACTSCSNLMDGGPSSGSLPPPRLPPHPACTCAPANSALLSSPSHTHLRPHLLVALITIRRPCVVPEADILVSSTQTRTVRDPREVLAAPGGVAAI